MGRDHHIHGWFIGVPFQEVAMSTGDKQSLHGTVGTGLGGFSRLLDANPIQPEVKVLDQLGNDFMADAPDENKDEPDPEENLYVPAGYTYLGQFVDHDLTLDTTSTFNVGDGTAFSNVRTASFDLDCVYGLGPDAAPYLYEDGIRLIEGHNDLPRSAPKSGRKRAIIGDPRNDENSIVCNIQMAFLRFHNKVVNALESQNPQLKGTRELFVRARNEVRWTYQKILMEDYLPRIINGETFAAFEESRDPNPQGLSRNEGAYALYTAEKRGAIPLEFAGAAYRFGHSMVRNGYRLNQKKNGIFKNIFDRTNDPDKSLVGFQPLPADGSHLIDDWSLFFPDPKTKANEPGSKPGKNGPSNSRRLQYAYRIDPTLVDPLSFLPSFIANDDPRGLAARNLRRGRKFQLPTGQAVAEALGVPVLDPIYLQVRKKTKDGKGNITEKFVPIDSALQDQTPLWFYLLAEAQVPVVDWAFSRGRFLKSGAKGKPFSEAQLLVAASDTATQLGETGGRILLEVFNGLLDADPSSYRNHRDASHAKWTPLIGAFRMRRLVDF